MWEELPCNRKNRPSLGYTLICSEENAMSLELFLPTLSVTFSKVVSVDYSSLLISLTRLYYLKFLLCMGFFLHMLPCSLLNRLNISGNYMYTTGFNIQKRCSAYIVYIWVSYYSQNTRRLFC